MQGNYNLYFVQNGKLEKIEYKSSFKIKLSKKEKEQLRQMRKHRSGTLTLEPTDLYKEFKDKIKAQIKGNCSGNPEQLKKLYFTWGYMKDWNGNSKKAYISGCEETRKIMSEK